MRNRLHYRLDREARGTSPDNDWLESEEGRRIPGVSPQTWQNYRDQRLIPFPQIGRKIYVSRADLDTFYHNHRIGKIF